MRAVSGVLAVLRPVRVTPREASILRYWRDFHAEQGWWPTLRESLAPLCYAPASYGSLLSQLQKLELKGLIVNAGSGKARTWRLAPGVVLGREDGEERVYVRVAAGQRPPDQRERKDTSLKHSETTRRT